MKIAIFHNFMDNIGGAEKVTLILARELNAELYTTNIDLEKIKKMGFSDLNIFSIGKIPINPPFRQQLALWKFRHLNLKKKYDFYIISGDWAMSGTVKNKPNLWYVHSPIREIWDLYENVRNNIVSQERFPKLKIFLFDIWVHYNRYLSRKYVKHAMKLISSSKNVQTKVKRFLDRKSTVIHPPTEISKFHYSKNGDFWLSVNRLSTQKNIELQIKTFKKLPNEKLIIAGPYENSRHITLYRRHLESTLPDNVTLISFATYDELIHLYANCKGFITTAKDEDYGMTPVEAMASGKPVIAPNEGGYKETIIDGITGKLIENINVDKLVEAIKEVGKNPKSYKNACLKQSKKFDTKIFIKKIKENINSSR